MLNSQRARAKSWLALILVGAVLVRLPAAFLMGDQVTALPGIHDQISYDALAQNLLAGDGYRFSERWYPFTPANTPTAHWSFLYPLFLAGVYGLAGYHPLAARLVQCALGGVLMCGLVYLIGRKAHGERTGLIAAAGAALYGFFVYYSAALMTETFFIVCVLLALYLSLALRERPTVARWLLLGLALGAASLLRQTILLFVPFQLGWLLWERRAARAQWWGGVAAAVVVALFILPWTIRNYVVYRQFLPLNSNAGYALFASTHPNLGTEWNNDKVVVPIPDALQGLNEAALDRALTRHALENILAEPSRYFWLSLDKIPEFFIFWPSASSSTISNLNRLLSFGVFLPFMLVGVGLSFPHWRRFVPLYLFIVIHSGIHLLTWPAPRYRLPVDAVLMVFAALAAGALATRLIETRRQLAPHAETSLAFRRGAGL